MHLNREVLVIDEASPFGKDLVLSIPPILCEEVVKAFDRSVPGDHVVSPLYEAQFHVFLPVTCQAAPHTLKSDRLAKCDLLIDHEVFESSGKFVVRCYSWCEELRNLLVLLHKNDWITCKFEPACKRISCDSTIAAEENLSKFVYCTELIRIAPRDIEQMLKDGKFVLLEDLLQSLFELSGGK